MSICSRELCPHCIELTEVAEGIELIREDSTCLVEKVTRYCQACNQALADIVTLKLKSE